MYFYFLSKNRPSGKTFYSTNWSNLTKMYLTVEQKELKGIKEWSSEREKK